MTPEILKVVGGVAGLGGISVALIVFLFREIIRKNIFPQLTKEQSYNTIRLIIFLAFFIGVLGLGIYAWKTWLDKNNDPKGFESKLTIYLDSVRWKLALVKIPSLHYSDRTNDAGEVIIQWPGKQDQKASLVVEDKFTREMRFEVQNPDASVYFNSEKFRTTEVAGTVYKNDVGIEGVLIVTELGDSTRSGPGGLFRFKIKSELESETVSIVLVKGAESSRQLINVFQTDLALDL